MVTSHRSVIAVCGVELVPLSLLYGRTVLPGQPPDPDQICPACVRGAGQLHTLALGAIKSHRLRLPVVPRDQS